MFDHPSRRQLMMTAGALALAGCSTTRRKSPFWATVTNTRPSAPAATTRAYADSLPYASMLFWADGQARSLIVLGTVDPDDRFTWYTPDKQAITTYGPFIVATAGTEVELRETRFGPGWNTDVRALVGRTLERQTTVANRAEARATLRSTFHDAGAATVKILDRRFQLTRVDEHVIAEDRVRFLNSYWVEPTTGTCYKSRQQALPTVSPINIEMLKFPAPRV